MEDSDEPYLDGVKYHAMPPLKRFRDMENLSGGEKTMAALALLFAVHSYQPSPFFVLDEVDAALDNANVARIANYIRHHAGPGMQFVVISLKTGLFQNSDALVGIYRDQTANSSRALTLDVSFFPWVLVLSCIFINPPFRSKSGFSRRTHRPTVCSFSCLLSCLNVPRNVLSFLAPSPALPSLHTSFKTKSLADHRKTPFFPVLTIFLTSSIPPIPRIFLLHARTTENK